jgi:cysteine desulfuration protein SufE
MRSLDDIREEYEFLDGDERYRLLIELGRELDPMPDALKTDATRVAGCSASVWVYPTEAGCRAGSPSQHGSRHRCCRSAGTI